MSSGTIRYSITNSKFTFKIFQKSIKIKVKQKKSDKRKEDLQNELKVLKNHVRLEVSDSLT